METSGLSGLRNLRIEPLDPRRSPEYSAMQLFFLVRLTHLMETSRKIHAAPSKEWQRTLVKKAIFSTFNDCIALSLEAEALEVVRGANGDG